MAPPTPPPPPPPPPPKLFSWRQTLPFVLAVLVSLAAVSLNGLLGRLEINHSPFEEVPESVRKELDDALNDWEMLNADKLSHRKLDSRLSLRSYPVNCSISNSTYDMSRLLFLPWVMVEQHYCASQETLNWCYEEQWFGLFKSTGAQYTLHSGRLLDLHISCFRRNAIVRLMIDANPLWAYIVILTIVFSVLFTINVTDPTKKKPQEEEEPKQEPPKRRRTKFNIFGLIISVIGAWACLSVCQKTCVMRSEMKRRNLRASHNPKKRKEYDSHLRLIPVDCGNYKTIPVETFPVLSSKPQVIYCASKSTLAWCNDGKLLELFKSIVVLVVPNDRGDARRIKTSLNCFEYPWYVGHSNDFIFIIMLIVFLISAIAFYKHVEKEKPAETARPRQPTNKPQRNIKSLRSTGDYCADESEMYSLVGAQLDATTSSQRKRRRIHESCLPSINDPSIHYCVCHTFDDDASSREYDALRRIRIWRYQSLIFHDEVQKKQAPKEVLGVVWILTVLR
ncbi:unnamed protein product [Caenorhabditis sp. 36 PRJEB53466]|nr:unnamed protein product [Caenorhabditis sp. 36 PRJEB53466]